MNVHQIRQEELINSLNQHLCDDVLNIICDYAAPRLSFEQRRYRQTREAYHRFSLRYQARFEAADMEDLEDYMDYGEDDSFHSNRVYEEIHDKFYEINHNFERSHRTCNWFIDTSR